MLIVERTCPFFLITPPWPAIEQFIVPAECKALDSGINSFSRRLSPVVFLAFFFVEISLSFDPGRPSGFR